MVNRFRTDINHLLQRNISKDIYYIKGTHEAILWKVGFLFSDSDFTVFARARSRQHLNILEAVYIWLREPILCKQNRL